MRKIAHWTECYTPAESVDILREFAYSHACKAGKIGLGLKRLLREQRFREICEFEVDYSGDFTVSELLHVRQALAFFSKLEHLEIGIDKEDVAWNKFLEAESACRETNRILRLWSRGDFQFPPRVEAAIHGAQRKIAMVLGQVPPLEKLGFRFGPGATTLTKKREASLREKFRAGIACSEELLPMAGAILAELPSLVHVAASVEVIDREDWWASVPVSIHDGKLDFVPKSAKTKRSVVTEPMLNGLFQLALGDHMTRRLAAFGVDLKDQTRNQRLALEGSFTGALATLDLSSASDTISKELVFHLLPLEWATLLARARTGHVTRKGERLTLEKFSSMGNGFTFPLESLIFWALTSAVCETAHGVDVTSVYGDDIICPTTHYHQVVEVLTAVGFTVNEKKSFHTGPFRESCGRDYYRGIDIRPYYQKDWVSPRSLFVLHNWYVRHGDAEMAESVLRLIHPSLRIYGPDGFGDGHLLGDHDRRRKPHHTRMGYAGYIFDTFTLKGRRDNRPPLPGDCALPSYSVYQRGDTPMFPSNWGAVDSVGMTLFRATWSRGHGRLVNSLPLPSVKVGEDFVKASSLPGEDGYKKMSIYTLGR